MSGVQENPKEGWGNPEPFRSTSKFHYFQENKRSLCGKWLNFANLITLEQGQDDHKDNCADCKRRKAKLNDKAAESEGA